MNEKRFNNAKSYVYDGKNCIGIINDDFSCENIINLLNALHEENTKLKKEFNSCSHNWALMYDEAKNKVEELSKENIILKTTNYEMEDYLARLEEENQRLAKQNIYPKPINKT